MKPPPIESIPAPPEAILPIGLREEWALDPAISFLNHGCYGARPRAVLEAQARWRLEFEARPVEFLTRRRDELLRWARTEVGKLLGMKPDDMGFVTNATAGVNAVLRSLRFTADDELLTTNHAYEAVRQTMVQIAEQSGAGYREVRISTPIDRAAEVVETIERALTARTRLLVIDHVTSPTAIVFPIREIIEMCEQRGVDVLVDGAHAPGMLALNIESLGAAYYAGNLHKWVCAPPGAGFLWVRRDRQAGIHPPVLSYLRNTGLASEFTWQGTTDVSPWLSAPVAVQYLGAVGWPAVMQHNHDLAVWAQRLLCARLNVQPLTPMDGSLIGSMATVPLPPGMKTQHEEFARLQSLLYDRYQIEAPIIDWDGRWWVRPSCQLYNRPEEYEQLAEALLELADR